VAIYDTEEEQVEALKSWWKENGRSVIVGAILGAGLILGWNYWKEHQQEQTLAASTLYEQLLSFVDQEKDNEATKIATQLIKQFPKTSYANYARLMQAKLNVNGGNLAAAKTILESVLKEKDIEFKNVARIRLVRLMLATKEYEKGLQLISEADPANIESFSANYDELTGDLYVALNRLGEARTAYQNAMRTATGSPLLQMKLDDITATELVTAPATKNLTEKTS